MLLRLNWTLTPKCSRSGTNKYFQRLSFNGLEKFWHPTYWGRSEVTHVDAAAQHPSALDDLLGVSTTYMPGCRPVLWRWSHAKSLHESSTCVQLHRPSDVILTWWKLHKQEFPDLVRMVRLYLPLLCLMRDPSFLCIWKHWTCCLLWIYKARAKEQTCIRVSVCCEEESLQK